MKRKRKANLIEILFKNGLQFNKNKTRVSTFNFRLNIWLLLRRPSSLRWCRQCKSWDCRQLAVSSRQVTSSQYSWDRCGALNACDSTFFCASLSFFANTSSCHRCTRACLTRDAEQIGFCTSCTSIL